MVQSPRRSSSCTTAQGHLLPWLQICPAPISFCPARKRRPHVHSDDIQCMVREKEPQATFRLFAHLSTSWVLLCGACAVARCHYGSAVRCLSKISNVIYILRVVRVTGQLHLSKHQIFSVRESSTVAHQGSTKYSPTD